MNVWRGFWRLHGPARGIVLEAAAVLLATRPGLRLAGFRAWKRVLDLFTPAASGEVVQQEVAQQNADGLAEPRAIARLAESAARHLPFRASCLERSLALWWLLRRRGIAAEIRIGARKDDNGFEAHAWVEWNGAILGGADAEAGFAPFDRPITAAEARAR